jgi:hypothetical protein
MLQPLDSLEYLLDLIGLGHTFVVLDVHPRVTLPGHPVDAMAGAELSRLTKVVIAHPTQVGKTHSFRIASHLAQSVIDPSHN